MAKSGLELGVVNALCSSRRNLINRFMEGGVRDLLHSRLPFCHGTNCV